MVKSQKNSFRKILSRCGKLFAIMLTAIASVFFAACGEQSKAENSGYDAFGNFRLSTPGMLYYETNSKGNYNEFTGSFVVPMEYYFNADKQNVDQTGDYGMQSFANNDPFPSNNYRYPDFTFLVDNVIYQVHVYVDTNKLRVYKNNNGGSNFDSKNYIEATASLDEIFKFSYRMGTSGEWLEADGFISSVYLTDGSDNKVDVISGQYGNQALSNDKVFYMLFNPMLQTGSTTRKIRVKAMPNLAMDIDLANNQAHKFDVINYDSNVINRGDSLYSQIITYNAYRLNFTAYSFNSSELGYGELSYDAGKYYFYTGVNSAEAYTYSLTYKKNYLTKLAGYFPSGRIVEVSRVFDTVGNTSVNVEPIGNNFAFQSWTANKKAVNSLVLEDTLPDASLNSILSQLGMFEKVNVDKYSLAPAFRNKDDINLLNDFTCLFSNDYDQIKKDNSKFAVKSFDPSMTNSQMYYSYEIYDSGTREGTIYVTSQKEYNGYNFYANYVKVKNFILSGTIFDAEKVLNFDDATLNGVEYKVYRNNANNVPEVIRTGTLSTATFSISELNIGDYIIFSRNVDGDETGELKYNFYGNDLSNIELGGEDGQEVLKNHVTNKDRLIGTIVTLKNYGRTYYLAPNQEQFYDVNSKTSFYVDNGKLYTSNNEEASNYSLSYVFNNLDLTNSSVLATKYDKDTSLIVNVYALENNNVVDPTRQNISYEVIKSVTSTVDAFGCVKTTVYISVVLPSNATIDSYNVITDNSMSAAVFTNGNDRDLNTFVYNKILKTIKLENKKAVSDYYFMDLLELSADKITKILDGSSLIYNDEVFNYSFKNNYSENESEKSTVYYIYQSTYSSNIIAMYEDNGVQKFDFLKLEKINYTTADTAAENYLEENSSYSAGNNYTLFNYINFGGIYYFNSSKNLVFNTDVNTFIPEVSTNNSKIVSTSAKYVYDFHKKPTSYFADLANSVTALSSFIGNNEELKALNLSLYYDELDKYFFKVTIEEKQNIAVANSNSDIYKANIITDSPDGTITSKIEGENTFTDSKGDSYKYYQFSYFGHTYYLYEGKIYQEIDIFNDDLPFVNEKTDVFGMYSYEFNFNTMTATFQRALINFKGTNYYVRYSTDENGKLNGIDGIYYDLDCGNQTINEGVYEG